MVTFSSPLTLPAPTGVARPTRSVARACPWGPPDPSTRIDVGWTPETALGSPWPAPDPARRVDWTPRAAGSEIAVAARTPLPPPPPSSLVVAPPGALADEVAPSPSSRGGWLIGLALVVAATVAAVLVNL